MLRRRTAAIIIGFLAVFSLFRSSTEPYSLTALMRSAGLLLLAGLMAPLWAHPARRPTPPALTPTPPIQQARNLVEWGRWKDARASLDQAIRQNPGDAELKAYQAHVLVAFGQLDAAVTLARQAVKQDANCATCHLYLSEALGDEAKHEGKFRALIELRKVRAELKRAQQLGPNIADVHWGWLDLDLDLPVALGGSPAAAMQEARTIGQIDPVDGYLARATVDLATGHNAAAQAEYREVAQRYPTDPRGLFALGLSLFQQGNYTAAEPLFRRAQRLQPQSALYAGYHAATLVHLHRQIRARDVLLKTRPMFPQTRLGDFLVAQALQKIGQDYVWARDLVHRYLQVPPEPDQPSVQQARQLLMVLG